MTAQGRTPQEIRTEIARLVEQYAALSLAPAPFIAGTTPVPPSGKLLGAQESYIYDGSFDNDGPSLGGGYFTGPLALAPLPEATAPSEPVHEAAAPELASSESADSKKKI